MARTAPVKVLLVSSHPVQYAAPQHRRYAADPRLDLTVAYCSLQGAEVGVDPEFGVEIAWDVPLLDGYRWAHPANRSPRPALTGFLGLVNPGLWPLVRRGRFDVVVCYGYRAASFWIAAAAAKASGASLVLSTDAHTLAPRDGRTWKARAKRALLPRIFALADGVLAPSTRTVTFLRDLGVGDDRLFLTPYVVDTGFFARAAARADRGMVRWRWGVPGDAPVALFCGKLVDWKRPADALEATAGVPGLHLVVAGDGPLRAALECRAVALGIAGRVRFLGFVNQSELPELYAAADLLVLPSAHEPFGLVVNEAFACGIPAVVSDACGAGDDLVASAETGFVVPVGDVAQLVGRLALLAGDPVLRRRLGDNARARIAAWGPRQNADAFAEACARLAAAGSR